MINSFSIIFSLCIILLLISWAGYFLPLFSSHKTIRLLIESALLNILSSNFYVLMLDSLAQLQKQLKDAENSLETGKKKNSKDEKAFRLELSGKVCLTLNSFCEK